MSACTGLKNRAARLSSHASLRVAGNSSQIRQQACRPRPIRRGIVLSGSSDAMLRELRAPERVRRLDGIYQAIVRMLAVIDN